MTARARSQVTFALEWLQAHRWGALFFTLPLVLGVHLISAAFTIRHSNQDPVASDQGAEMWLAATAREDPFPQRTDGVRHPLWSWLARYLYTEDKLVFFERGKWLNTTLCIIFLAGLAVAVVRWLDPLATANLLLLSSLGILLVRGTYFQPEPLYYVLFFLATVLAWKILHGAPLRLYLVFGIVCGLAFLAKPSLLPFLLVFCLAFALRAALALAARDTEWSIRRNLAGMAIAFAILAVMLVPLARFSAQHFGTPLFNYTKFWMWMDDFMTEAWPFQDRYPGRVQLEQLPEEEKPSPSSYFKRHGLADAGKRLASGTQEVLARFFFPESKLRWSTLFWRSPGKKWEQPLAHRGIYLLLLAILCGFLVSASRPAFMKILRRPGNLAGVVFAAVLTTLYLLLYGWYWPIGRGDRFMGSFWIPSVFALIWLAFELRRRLASSFADISYLAVHGAILISLALQIAGMLWRFSQGIYLVTRN
jgi:hypothetical protein